MEVAVIPDPMIVGPAERVVDRSEPMGSVL